MQSLLALVVIPTSVLFVMVIVLFLLLLWLGYVRAPRIFGFGSHIVKTTETVEYATGDEETGQPQTRSITTETQSARTVWEWLTVLTISAVITVVALIFTARQAQQQRETQFQQASDDALQAYYDEMSTLLIEEDLRTSPENSEARTLARSRTLTILSRLDPERRSRVLRFLLEAELVQRLEQKNPVITLSGADLSGVFVPADTNLSYADLSGTDLSGANLSDANLSTAYLMATDLHEANLSRATLSFSDLGLADLSDANLSDADLTLAQLNDADLSGTDLTGADLWQADLSDAKGGVTEKTLGRQAGYVGDTTMPDGHMSGVHMTGGGKWGDYPSGRIPPGTPGMNIPAGEYNSDEFVPAFHFEVDEGWQAPGIPETTDYISLKVGLKGEESFSETELIITNPSYVWDASEQKEIPAPENVDKWVSWFQEHPNLETSELKPVSVGSASGMQIDVTPKSTTEVALYNTQNSGLYAFEGRIERFLVVSVGDETVVVNVSASVDKSKEFFSKAQKLLDTLEWKGV
jgi:uncharacterized protein YjbI with pentapeptide repeats